LFFWFYNSDPFFLAILWQTYHRPIEVTWPFSPVQVVADLNISFDPCVCVCGLCQ
jgi:hypothetical protein